MALNTDVPQWLVDTSKWIQASGERNVGEFFAGAQAVQQLSQNALAIQAQKNNLEIQPAMNLLKLQEMQLQVGEQSKELELQNKDQQQIATAGWQNFTPESQKYITQKWQYDTQRERIDVQRQAVENQTVAAKVAVNAAKSNQKQIDSFVSGLDSVDVETAAKINYQGGLPTPEQVGIMNEYRKLNGLLPLGQTRQQVIPSKSAPTADVNIFSKQVGNKLEWFWMNPNTGKEGRFSNMNQNRVDSLAVKSNGLNQAIAELNKVPENQRSTQQESKLTTLKSQLAQNQGEIEALKQQEVGQSPQPANNLKPGQRVRNTKTGEMGIVNQNGVVVPESAF